MSKLPPTPTGGSRRTGGMPDTCQDRMIRRLLQRSDPRMVRRKSHLRKVDAEAGFEPKSQLATAFPWKWLLISTCAIVALIVPLTVMLRGHGKRKDLPAATNETLENSARAFKQMEETKRAGDDLAAATACTNRFFSAETDELRLQELRNVEGAGRRYLEYRDEIQRLLALKPKVGAQFLRKAPFLVLPVTFSSGEIREAWCEVSTEGVAQLDLDALIGTCDVKPSRLLEQAALPKRLLLRGHGRLLKADVTSGTPGQHLEFRGVSDDQPVVFSIDKETKIPQAVAERLRSKEAVSLALIVSAAAEGTNSRGHIRIDRVVGNSWFIPLPVVKTAEADGETQAAK